MSILYDIKLDIAARLAADEDFSSVEVLALKEKDLVSELTDRLNRLKLAATVVIPSATVQHPNIPKPYLSPVMVQVGICENRLLNDTGKTAEDIAEVTLRLLHCYTPGPFAQPLYAADPTITELVPEREQDKNKRLIAVQFITSCLIDIDRTQLANVGISPLTGAVPQTVTLTHGTSGTSIYYTVDGTYPWSGNSEATLYEGPLSISQACFLRACAHKTGWIASNTASATYTAT